LIETLYAAVTEGVKNLEVTAYLDSILSLLSQMVRLKLPRKLRSSLGTRREAEILQSLHLQPVKFLGMRLAACACCDKLEKQVSFLYNQSPLAVLEAKMAEPLTLQRQG